MSKLASALRLLGVDVPQLVSSPKAMARFIKDFYRFHSLLALSASPMPFGKLYPCIHDYNAEGGLASGHYFHQDLIVAQRVFQANPVRHVDVGSRVDGFIAHLAVFRNVEVFDIRPLTTTAKNIVFRRFDIMEDLRPEHIDYCDSLSCLHALEHFGLGRYGDRLDPDGHLKGFNNLSRLLRTGGALYLAVPIGPNRIEFNAHRVFAIQELINLFAGRFDVRRFSVVNDEGQLHDDLTLTSDGMRANFGCNFGLGIFELHKI